MAHEATMNNKECLLFDSHVSEWPEGYPFRYFLRHGDNGNPCTIEIGCPVVSFWGTVFFKKPLKFAKQNDIFGHPIGRKGYMAVRGWGWL